jgi:GPI mannosyltransferase 3
MAMLQNASETVTSSRKRYLLLALLAIALSIRVTAAIRNSSMVHPDEVFQTLEPAHRLAYGYGVVTWEWRDGVRSWVFPAFLASIMRATGWMGAGSAGYLLGIAVVLSLISLTPVWFGFVWADRVSGTNAAILVGGMCAVWYELVIFAPRALNEVVAAHLLLPGLYLGTYAGGRGERKQLFIAGALCGLAMSLRIQLAPAIVFIALFLCHSNWRTKSLAVFAGLVSPVILFGLVDAATWQYPFQSFVRYFWVNVVEGRSTLYGTAPWYWYLFLLSGHLSLLFVLVLAGVPRSPVLGAIALIILTSHSFLAHKEVRFLYPLMPILIVLAGLGAIEVANEFELFVKSERLSRTVILAGLILFTLASSFLGSRFEYRDTSGSLTAFDQLSLEKALCGVGLYGVPWFYSGGYAHLHRNVPITLISGADEFTEGSPGFDAVLADERLSIPDKAYRLVRCWNGVCLYRRTASCVLRRQGEINMALREKGE